MLSKYPTVIIIDSQQERAEEFASLVRFLGLSASIANDENAFLETFRALPDVLAIFACADTDFRWLSSVLRPAGESPAATPCYLLERAKSVVRVSLPAFFTGVVARDASYKELLAVLGHAELLHDHRVSADDAQAVILYRNLIGTSSDIESVRHLARQVAATDASVLIQGESGTGKEVVASCVHSLSARRDLPFVPINCGAIPAELLESELFGHEKGAFTGAISARQGRFEMAEGGTLFLDEIGDMPLDMQVKLLRVLQERKFERVGSSKSVPTNVRIIAASHRNLDQMVAEGSFRMDLFYRLNVFPIEISPLRDRVCDIPLLINDFISRLEREQHRALRLSDCTVASLVRHHWPGNVRELFNLLERLAILYPERLVKWSDLPEKIRPNEELFDEQFSESQDWRQQLRASLGSMDLPQEGIDLKLRLADIERSLMEQALDRSEWVVARAAKLLNLQRTTLVEKMRKFDIQRPEELTGS